MASPAVLATALPGAAGAATMPGMRLSCTWRSTGPLPPTVNHCQAGATAPVLATSCIACFNGSMSPRLTKRSGGIGALSKNADLLPRAQAQGHLLELASGFRQQERPCGPTLSAQWTNSRSRFSSTAQAASASPALPANDPSNRHTASALLPLARLLGRLAARQTLQADAGIELTNEGLRETSGSGAAS